MSGYPSASGQTCSIQASVIPRALIAIAFTPSSPVHFQIYESKQAFDAAAAPFFDATYQSGDDGNAHVINPDLAAANYVVVTDQATGTVKTLDVSPVRIDEVNRETDTVSGTARPGETVGVTVNGGTSSMAAASVVTQADGTWSAGPSDFQPSSPDITAQSDVSANVTDEDGDYTGASPPFDCSPHPERGRHWCSVEVHLDNDLIGVAQMSPNFQVSFRVFDRRGGQLLYGPVTRTTNDQGDSELINLAFDAGIDLVPAGTSPLGPAQATYVEATDLKTSTVKGIEIADVSIDEVNPDTNVVRGRAPAGETVYVSPAGGGAGTQGVPSDGTWTIDWQAAAGFDITSQDSFTAELVDPGNGVTFGELGAPLPACEADLCGTAGPDTVRVGETPPTALKARAAGVDHNREAFVGPGDDTVLVTVRKSVDEVEVDTGTGAVDRVVVNPPLRPRRRGPPLVVVHGATASLIAVLPAHPGSLRARVTGGAGADQVSTRKFGGRGLSRGRYRIVGRGGNDALASGDAADRLIGGSGDDVLNGKRGHDEMNGGPGSDTCFKGRGDTVRACETVIPAG